MELNMAKRRIGQKQVWSDEKFIQRLERIKAKTLLEKNEQVSLTEITRQLAMSPLMDELENEIIRKQAKLNLKIKLDNQRRFI